MRAFYNVLVGDKEGTYAGIGNRIATNHSRAHTTIFGFNTKGSEG